MGVMMDSYKVTSKDGYFDGGDIEKGEVNVKLDSSRGSLVFGSYTKMSGLHFNDGGLGSDNVLVKNDERVVSSLGSSCGGDGESVKLMVVDEERSGDVERKMGKEKPKAMSAKKPPKPPRPPRGLSLDSADQKLIRELHELARLKRARVERMKALKKSKEAKVASSKNQLFATLLTILFCIVLLFQGISSRTSAATNSQGSHISSRVTEHNIISVQHHPATSAYDAGGPGFGSPRLVEPVSGVDTAEQVSRAVG